MSRLVFALILLAAPPLSATPRVRTSPPTVVIGETKRVVLEISGLVGEGPVAADVNVGRVLSLQLVSDRVRVTYAPPKKRFPQKLCMLLWRQAQPHRVLVVRHPLFARATLPIQTRRNAQVTLTIGDKVFGPQTSSGSGRLRMEVLVPPGVSEGQAHAIGDKGMESRKTIVITRRPYNLLALVADRDPRRSATPRPTYLVTIAAAAAVDRTPTVTLVHPGQENITLQPQPKGRGRWSVRWTPGEEVPAGEWSVEVQVQGSALSRRHAALNVPALPTTPVAAAPPPPKEVAIRREAKELPATDMSRVGWSLSLGVGMLHNTGELVSPRFTFAAGVDYPLWRGRIGLSLLTGTSWASQEIAVEGVESSTADVVLVPLGAALTYSIPLRPVTPYVAAGVLAQVIRTTSEGEHSGRLRRTDVAAGGLFVAGARLGLGPGAIFLQLGYQYSRLENPDVQLLAGGVVLEAGYRLQL